VAGEQSFPEANVTAARNSWLHCGAALALLVTATVFLHARQKPEPDLARKPLVSLPHIIGPWVGRDYTIAPETLEVLGPGDFLSRGYRDAATGAPVDLFIAFFSDQRVGDTIHSPQNCLPGAGWAPLERGSQQLTRPDGGKITVNRFVIGKGLDRDLVLYWYQAHGRVVASEYWAKLYLVTDAMRTNRSDGSLVRVVTPVGSRESTAQAGARAVKFAEQLLPLLDEHIPR
jgi:EpsI family protein